MVLWATHFTLFFKVNNSPWIRKLRDEITKKVLLLIIFIMHFVSRSSGSKTPQKILICLSFTLLCLYVVFVVGIGQTDESIVCAIIAALLHYWTLSSVCWMGVQAVNMYFKLVKILPSGYENPHFMLMASLAAWGKV